MPNGRILQSLVNKQIQGMIFFFGIIYANAHIHAYTLNCTKVRRAHTHLIYENLRNTESADFGKSPHVSHNQWAMSPTAEKISMLNRIIN